MTRHLHIYGHLSLYSDNSSEKLSTMFALLLAVHLVNVSSPAVPSPHSFRTGHYRNLFREIGKRDDEIQAKVDAAWKQLFYGDDKDQRIYFPSGQDEGYIKDVGSNDVRSEGMSYGMMLSVQLGHHEEFDRLWRWADRHMRYHSGPWKGFFAWQCSAQGKVLGETPASDGEEYFAMALFFAAGRWGSTGEINYRKEADSILHAMLHKQDDNHGVIQGVTNMINRDKNLVVFVPTGSAAELTDPSYQLPAFYELWASWAKEDGPLWKQVAAASRAYLKTVAHPQTGLVSDVTDFAGKPTKLPWDPRSNSNEFLSDSLRVAGNIGMDYAWFGVDPWEVTQNTRMLSFFASQKPDYASAYTYDGKPLVSYRSAGHTAMNAAGTLATSKELGRPFVEQLWKESIPSGQWRYYDGMLYFFGLLHASGNYRIWRPIP